MSEFQLIDPPVVLTLDAEQADDLVKFLAGSGPEHTGMGESHDKIFQKLAVQVEKADE